MTISVSMKTQGGVHGTPPYKYITMFNRRGQLGGNIVIDEGKDGRIRVWIESDRTSPGAVVLTVGPGVEIRE